MSGDVKMRPPWSKEICTECGQEAYATRTQARPIDGPYVCSDCNLIARYEARIAELEDERDGAKALLAQEREKARRLASEADARAWRELARQERREGIAPSPLELAAYDAVSAWLEYEHKSNPGWWPSWEEMRDLEREHKGNPLTDVIRRIVGLQHAPLSQVLDTLRFSYFVGGPWRARALRKLSEARKALGAETDDDVPDAARMLKGLLNDSVAALELLLARSDADRSGAQCGIEEWFAVRDTAREVITEARALSEVKP